MSPTSTWSGPESTAGEEYPLALFKRLLQQMMGQFAAHGACLALLDESVGQMRVVLHVRQRHLSAATAQPGPMQPPGIGPGSMRRRMTVHLEHDGDTAAPRSRISLPSPDDIEEVTPGQCSLLAVGSTYSRGQDLIGFAWQKNDAFIVKSHEEYLELFHRNPDTIQSNIIPSSYLIVPVEEPALLTTPQEQSPALHAPLAPTVTAVVVLYQVTSGIGSGFQSRQRTEALQAVERIALYLQNDKLQRAQRRTSDYLQLLQEISTTFPTTVSLADLVEKMYRVVAQVVNFSSLLLTLYDRDTERIYDVLAISNGVRIEGLTEQPIIAQKEQRPVWWELTQKEKRALQFSPAHDSKQTRRYRELLSGVWGEQQHNELFLLLPMKIFTRVTGSLALCCADTRAYQPEEIQVLETMVQIVTVGIENVKLYERDRQLLQEARQQKAQMAGINSALQAISAVLNVSGLLNNFVASVASLVNVDLCVFFQPTANGNALAAQALYGLSTASQLDDGSDLPAIAPPRNKATDDELIRSIRIAFQDTFLEQMVAEGSFFYLDADQLEELAQQSEVGGAIFLYETFLQSESPEKPRMLMVPMMHEDRLIGLLGVPTSREGRFFRSFRPNEVGTLLAICTQAINGLRNAQLFEEREEAYAELQHMDKLKDEFMVTASHELRTPLSAIVGYTSLLKRQSARISPPQILRFATRIGSAAQQLLDLVTNMTVAAQMGAMDKKMEMTIAPVHVLSAAEIAASMLALGAEQKIVLKVDAALWVNGDALHFRQVITNLLDNAAKYSPPESQITLSAELTTLPQILDDVLPDDQVDNTWLVEKEDAPIVLIRVQDQGEGIHPDDQPKIFDKFVRASRTLTTPIRGSGLGLYICRRYVEAMSGRLWLERSTHNEGSIFTFYLPYVESPIETGENETGEHQSSSYSGRG
jgi:signal transduction histidine kinase